MNDMPDLAEIGPTSSQLLAGRRILVTGASGGIGSAVMQTVVRHGAEAIGTDRSPVGTMLALDAADETSVAAFFVAAGPFTDVIHAAGTLAIGRIADMKLADFREAVEANLTGAFVVAREAARLLPRGGSITLIASQAGFRGAANWGAYCAVKAGVMRLAEALAQELGPRGVRANSVCPGNVDTPMADEAAARIAMLGDTEPAAVKARYESAVPLGRYATPEEVASACVFLASPLAAYVSGISLPVDGGEVSA